MNRGRKIVFFEASEKKIEMVVSDINLRDLGEVYWKKVVAECHATVISSLSSDQVDAYLLSESSLFVWSNRMVMITCGEIPLSRSIMRLINDVGRDRIQSLIFQRKNEFDESRQKTTFIEDVKALGEFVDGSAYRFGHPDGHHHYMFSLNQPYSPAEEDRTAELLMYHIAHEAAEIFYRNKTQRQEARELLLLDQFEDFAIDDYFFQPYGYSCNGVKGDRYFTIHVTPQREYSYISCEMNFGAAGDCDDFFSSLVSSLRPRSFDLVTFNASDKMDFSGNYYESDQVQMDLVCGYRTHFYQYNSVCHKPRSPDLLMGAGMGTGAIS